MNWFAWWLVIYWSLNALATAFFLGMDEDDERRRLTSGSLVLSLFIMGFNLYFLFHVGLTK